MKHEQLNSLALTQTQKILFKKMGNQLHLVPLRPALQNTVLELSFIIHMEFYET